MSEMTLKQRLRDEAEQMKQALRPDVYNMGLTGLVFLGSSFSWFQYLLLGPSGFTGNATAGFPFQYWAAVEVADPASMLQATHFEPVLLLADLVILYILVAALLHVGREGFQGGE